MAVTITAAELAGILKTDAATATRLLAVATELVQDYAPDAPESLQTEAAIRCAGWINQASGYGYIREGSTGDLTVAYSTSQKNALYHSGAAALLTRSKQRRAGAI